MYRPISKKMEKYIRNTGEMRLEVYTTHKDTENFQQRFQDTPYKLLYTRRFMPDGSDNSSHLPAITGRIAEVYLTIDSSKILARYFKPHEKLKMELPYLMVFMELALEKLIGIAKAMSVNVLMVESKFEHITELFLDKGFSIELIGITGNRENRHQEEYRGTLKIR
jgi:hypothetical protein